jgi:hypothetical protein
LQKRLPKRLQKSLQEIRSLFHLAFDSPSRTGTRRVQRLAIPHTFNDGLSFPEAVIATAQAFLRIFLSCFLFALWGTLALWLWSAMGNWRWLVPLPLLALFLTSFLAVMIGISAAAKAVAPKRV